MDTCGRHPVSLQHCPVPVAVCQELDDTKNLRTFIQESFAIFSLELQFLVSRGCVGTLIKGKWDLSCQDCVKNLENRTLFTNVPHMQGHLKKDIFSLFIYLII